MQSEIAQLGDKLLDSCVCQDFLALTTFTNHTEMVNRCRRTVGILLCPHADKCDVKYTLDRTMSPMMVAEYRRLLIPEEVMKKSLEEYSLL